MLNKTVIQLLIGAALSLANSGIYFADALDKFEHHASGARACSTTLSRRRTDLEVNFNMAPTLPFLMAHKYESLPSRLSVLLLKIYNYPQAS